MFMPVLNIFFNAKKGQPTNSSIQIKLVKNSFSQGLKWCACPKEICSNFTAVDFWFEEDSEVADNEWHNETWETAAYTAG